MRDVWLDRLEADGLVQFEDETPHTTRRWKAAMARAALILRGEDDGSDDLRVPIAAALLDLYGGDLSEAAVAEMVLAMYPIELTELGMR